MNSIETIALEDVEERCSLRDFEILKVNLKLDMRKIREVYFKIKEQHEFLVKDGDPLYRGISLHYNDEKNPFFDGLQQMEYSQEAPRLFYKQNELAKKFSYFFSQLPFQIYRSRLLESHPGHRLAEHSDGPVRLTLHLPLTSHADSLLYVHKRPYCLESDGSIYIVNTSYPHWIENKGGEVRAHLIGNISRMSFWPINPSYMEKLDQYYIKIGAAGFDKMLKAIQQIFSVPQSCAQCRRQTALFPLVADFQSEGLFRLLCKPCTEKEMSAGEFL